MDDCRAAYMQRMKQRGSRFIQYCSAGKARAGGCRSLCLRSYEMAALAVSLVYHDISAIALIIFGK